MKKYEKKVIIAVSFVIVVSLFLALIFYLSLTTAGGLSNSDWLNFWGSYAGSILALMGALIAIIYSNHNSECAIIFSCDLQLRYVYGFDIDMKQTKVDLDYFNSWNRCRIKLSDMLDKYMNLVELIAQNKFDAETKKMEAQLLSLNKQIFEATSDIQQRNICYSEMIDHSHNIEKLEEQLNGYCKKVDTLVEEYSQMTSELLLMVKDLFNKSVLVQIENRQILEGVV